MRVARETWRRKHSGMLPIRLKTYRILSVICLATESLVALEDKGGGKLDVNFLLNFKKNAIA